MEARLSFPSRKPQVVQFAAPAQETTGPTGPSSATSPPGLAGAVRMGGFLAHPNFQCPRALLSSTIRSFTSGLHVVGPILWR